MNKALNPLNHVYRFVKHWQERLWRIKDPFAKFANVATANVSQYNFMVCDRNMGNNNVIVKTLLYCSKETVTALSLAKLNSLCNFVTLMIFMLQ